MARSEAVATLPPPPRAGYTPTLASMHITQHVLALMNARKMARSSVEDISEVLKKPAKKLFVRSELLGYIQTHGRIMNAGADPGMPTSSVFGTWETSVV